MRTIGVIIITLAIVAVGAWATWEFYLKKKLLTIYQQAYENPSPSYNPSSLITTAWGGVVNGTEVIGNDLGNGTFMHNSGTIYSLSNGKQI